MSRVSNAPLLWLACECYSIYCIEKAEIDAELS